MASVPMTSSFLGGSLAAAATTKKPSTTVRHQGVVMAKTSKLEKVEVVNNREETSINGRRDLMFAVAAAAVGSIANVAMADEPKKGSAEAKKKYGPVCVTMPTARICRN